MQRLPLPRDVIPPEPSLVPYVCGEDYDGGPFLQYLHRKGKADLSDAFIKKLPMEQSMITLPPINGFDGFDALIQTWLFFGLLNEILGTLFTPSQFVRTINSQDRPSQVVDTSDLLPVLDVWVKAVQQPGRTKVQKQAQFKHITACLQLTNDVFRGLECNDQLLPNRLIKHSIVSVAEVLFDAAYQAFQSRELPKVPIHWVRFYQDAETSLQLSRHGFCPSEIKRISTHSRLFKPIIV